MRIVYHNPETNHTLTVSDNGNATFMELSVELNEKIRRDNAMTTEHSPNSLADQIAWVLEQPETRSLDRPLIIQAGDDLARLIVMIRDAQAEALGDVWEAVDALRGALTRLETRPAPRPVAR
jgi:hypothetical protein